MCGGRSSIITCRSASSPRPRRRGPTSGRPPSRGGGLDRRQARHGRRLFAAGERPTGTRDPFGLRRQAQGLLRTLVDLPELTGLELPVPVDRMLVRARQGVGDVAGVTEEPEAWRDAVTAFLVDRCVSLRAARLRLRRTQRRVRPRGRRAGPARHAPTPRGAAGGPDTADFEALAVAFRRVKNLSRELQGRRWSDSTG